MLKIVFADDSLMVLDKSANLVVTSSATEKEETLEDILRQKYHLKLERAGIVHRLDKDTSGLIVVAKKMEALEKLQAQFKERTVKKVYLALVHGWVEQGGRIEVPIMRNPENRKKFTTAWQHRVLHSREAVTEYKPIKLLVMGALCVEKIFAGFNKIQFKKLQTTHYPQFSLLRCYPKTGRTHQIRVHLKYINHPIVGDEKYGGRKMVRLDKRWCPRQFLHAAKLEFNHPVTGMRMKFESRLTEDLQKVLDLLEPIKI